MEISKKLAEIIGIHMGDGCISINSRYSEYAILGDISEEKEYYDKHLVPLYNQHIFIPILKKKVLPKSYKKNGTYGIIVFKKEITDYFQSLGVKSGSKLNMSIPKVILDNKKLWNHFIRGVFDTDGSIYFNKNYSVKEENRKHNQPRIKLGMTSKKVIMEIYSMLKELGYKPYLKPSYKGKRDKNPVYSIMLQRREDIKRYIKEIGFNSTKHQTKWKLYQERGYCPPNTTLEERYNLLKNPKGL
ncbi:MAG: LAGLIDADG family homing endonuclease [Nanoarchaeota archaeon]|nr:LAGLIDADG family homing endonuclease [Nanoarchaeota archaeon]